jgi:hypothetical protein
MIFLVVSGFVLHEQRAHRTHTHDRACDDGARHDHDDVDRIAVARQRVRYEPVVAGIEHCRVEETIDPQRARNLVEFVLDRTPPCGISIRTLTSCGGASPIAILLMSIVAPGGGADYR